MYVEIGFQVVAMLGLWLMRRKHSQTGQHFHLYLIGYGVFRFGHESLRARPKPFYGWSGYQILGLATAVAAVLAYRQRKNGLKAWTTGEERGIASSSLASPRRPA